MRRLAAAAAGAVLLALAPGAGADIPGATAGAFAPIDVGARVLGLGGAGVVAERGAFAGYWNPANLAFLPASEVAVDHTDLFGLGIARHTEVGLAWRRVATRRAIRDGRLVYEPRGGQLGFGYELGVTTVDLDPETYTELAPAFSIASRLSSGIGAGGTLRILRASSDLDDLSATGYALDLGLALDHGAAWSAGATARNLLSTVSWSDDTSDRLPLSLAVGAAHRGLGGLPGLLLAAEATASEDHFPIERVNLGGEWIRDPLALRAGLVLHQDRGEDRVELTLGAGTRFRGLHLDYAYLGDNQTLDSTQRLSLRLTF
jgi:hypothetical protein